MKLLKEEQETIINFNAAENSAIVYTRDKSVMRKFDTLINVDPEHYRLIKVSDIDRTYEMPKTYVNYRVSRRLTDAQRIAARKRMERVNNNKSEENTERN